MHCSNAIRTFSRDKGSWRKPRLFAVPSNLFIKILNSSRYCIPLLHPHQITLLPSLMVAKDASWLSKNFSGPIFFTWSPKCHRQYAIATVHSGNCQPTGTRRNIPSCGCKNNCDSNEDCLDVSTLSAPLCSLFIIISFLIPFNWTLIPFRLDPTTFWINLVTIGNADNTPPNVKSLYQVERCFHMFMGRTVSPKAVSDGATAEKIHAKRLGRKKSSYDGTKLNAVSTCFWGEKSPQKAAADGAAENIRVKS